MYLMHGICKICHGKTGMIKSVCYFQIICHLSNDKLLDHNYAINLLKCSCSINIFDTAIPIICL